MEKKKNEWKELKTETLPVCGNITEFKISISFFWSIRPTGLGFSEPSEFHKPIIISGFTLKNISINIFSF